jgi:2-keto-4-pentenoate hydratase/2-oxohepta-3-ene-1,7-dioic acid hydratase in catechol pathway
VIVIGKRPGCFRRKFPGRLGYTIGDVSNRAAQFNDGQWAGQKPHFLPIGPAIVTDLDDNLNISCRLDGQTMQDSTLRI